MTNNTSSSIHPSLDSLSIDQLKNYFLDAWNTYELLFESLLEEKAFMQRTHPLRHPLIFYLAHTASFYVQKLKLAGVLANDLSDLDRPMERGVSPDDPDELTESQNWPSLDEVRKYRKVVHEYVLDTIDSLSLNGKVTHGSATWAILMGIEHENIHLHTSMPLIRLLPDNLKRVPAQWPQYGSLEGPGEHSSIKELDSVHCNGGEVEFGKNPDTINHFRWDNELGVRNASISPFQVAPHPVTNADFLEFIRDGGYERAELWTTHQSSTFRNKITRNHPNSWMQTEPGEYLYRGVFGTHEMPWSWPVEVCRHEAVAFANWASASLISEAQFHCLMHQEHGGPEAINKRIKDFNVGLRFGSPLPVKCLRSALGANGTDYIGNVGLWMNDDFGPLDPSAFAIDPLYEDFSEPWFGPQTGLVLGASYAARGHMADIGGMRDFMQNHMDQFAGILLTRDA